FLCRLHIIGLPYPIITLNNTVRQTTSWLTPDGWSGRPVAMQNDKAHSRSQIAKSPGSTPHYYKNSDKYPWQIGNESDKKVSKQPLLTNKPESGDNPMRHPIVQSILTLEPAALLLQSDPHVLSLRSQKLPVVRSKSKNRRLTISSPWKNDSSINPCPASHVP